MGLFRPHRPSYPTIPLPPRSPSHQKLYDIAYGREWGAALARGESPVRAYVSASAYARAAVGPMPGDFVFGYELSALRRFLPPGVSPAGADENAVGILEVLWLGLTRDELNDAKEFLDARDCPATPAAACCASVWAAQRTVERMRVFAEHELESVYLGCVGRTMSDACSMWDIDERALMEWMGEHETPDYDPRDTVFLSHYVKWRSLLDA